MDASDHGHTFDFGDFSDDAVKKVLQDFTERGYASLEVNEEERNGCLHIAQQFVLFVATVLRQRGLMDEGGVVRARAAAEIDISVVEKTSPGDMLRALWSDRAIDWAAVETPQNYLITMQTLLENLRGSGRRSGEHFLSLGSGPGLYETFLAYLCDSVPPLRNVRVTCVDFAEEITHWHQELLKGVRLPHGRVIPVTDDMTRLHTIHTNSIDQIICNNALQWVPQWQDAIAEMARVMRPAGLGWLYLFVHLHPMSVFTGTGERLFRLGDFTVPEVLDALEAHKFQIENMRQIAGRKGIGQGGGTVERIFIRARYRARGIEQNWRNATVRGAINGL